MVKTGKFLENAIDFVNSIRSLIEYKSQLCGIWCIRNRGGKCVFFKNHNYERSKKCIELFGEKSNG